MDLFICSKCGAESVEWYKFSHVEVQPQEET